MSLDLTVTPVWTFLADWENDTRETLEWKSAELRSPTGASQRYQARIAPRRYLEINFKLFFNERAYFDLLMMARQSADWLVPVVYDVEALRTDCPVGTQTFAMDTSDREFVEGDYVLFLGVNAQDFAVYKIYSVQETFLQIVAPTARDWPVGTKLYPLIWCRISAMPQFTRTGPAVFQGSIRFMSIQANDWPLGSNKNMLMNAQGMVVNAYHWAAGRGDYFNQASGTSEGQLIILLGLLAAHGVLGDSVSRGLIDVAVGPIRNLLYRGHTPPAQVSVTQIFAPHWLFVTKKPFKAAVVEYNETFQFTDGVCVMPDDNKGQTRYVYQVCDASYELLWKNPYSSLILGSSYAIETVTYNVQTEETIITLVDRTKNGAFTVIHSAQTGNRLEIGQLYEAWPDWRPLAEGEIDCACDTIAWAHRAFILMYQLTGDAWYQQAAQANVQQAAIVYDVNDSRDWLKPTYSNNPFSIGSRYKFSSRGSVVHFATDGAGNVTMRVPTGTGEAQYGNASVLDTYHDADTTTVTVGSNIPMQVTIFIDPTQTYVEANRYRCLLNLSGNGLDTFNLTRNNFKNPAGSVIPAEMSVYTVGFEDTWHAGHILTIQRIRQRPNLDVLYYKGPIPFTANFLGNPATLIDWRGPVYMGYQSPWMWAQIGDDASLTNCLTMLHDAQTQWTTQTGQTGQRGPFAPVFYFNRDDAVQYGPKNTFGWAGPDPNTKWGGYQYRTLADMGHLFSDAAGHGKSWYSLLGQVLQDFMTWLDAGWTSGGGPPTDFPEGPAETNYSEPHFSALIMRTAIFIKQAGTASSLNNTWDSLITKAYTHLHNTYVSTGKMRGTWSSSPTTTQEWYGFWHGEILRTLGMFVPYATGIGATAWAAEATMWLQGMVAWAYENTLQADPVTTLNNFEVHTQIPDQGPDGQYGYERELIQFDNETGIPFQQDTAGRGFPTQSLAFTIIGRSQHTKYRDLLYKFAGMVKPLWVPTFNSDLLPTADIAANQSYIEIKNIGYAKWGLTTADRQIIAVFRMSGVVTLHTITGAATVDAFTERLTINAPIADALAVGEIRFISFLTLMRGNSDSIEIAHVTANQGVSTSQLTLRAAPDLRSASPIAAPVFANVLQVPGMCIQQSPPPSYGHDLQGRQILGVINGRLYVGLNPDGSPIYADVYTPEVGSLDAFNQLFGIQPV